MSDYNEAPTDLPVPLDDGACDHLQGQTLPDLTLPSTDGPLSLTSLPPRTILFLYPATGTPGTPLPEGWDAIPGARGCTPESLSFKTSHAGLLERGYTVYGLSAQSPAEHKEARERLALPYHLISDAQFALTRALSLPTFRTKEGKEYITRATLILHDGRIERVFYPVFPTGLAAQQVLKVLRAADV